MYEDFLASKWRQADGRAIPIGELGVYGMFPHQTDLVRWSLRRGRAAIFADTGLGKTRMQIAWADQVRRSTGGDVLILAPLAVAAQTVREAADVGVSVAHVREPQDIQPGINITNYDRLHKFDPERFSAVVLDESSIIKHHTSKTLAALLDAFRSTEYKLCATATPAPNDWTELGNHAEFLGVCTQQEMLAEYFVHDGGETQTWRLKKHARKMFWRWVASWGAMVRSPADLGHDGSRYELPPLHVVQHTIETPNAGFGLFQDEAQTLMERRQARRDSVSARVSACADIVNASDEPWVVWCDLNAEGDALESAIRGAVQVAGADDNDVKERRLIAFAGGDHRVMVSKPSICGFGLNWQHCRNIAFVGVTDSFESYYQAVRRCWRFGQSREVTVHIFASDREGAVVANLQRKETDARAMADAMSAETLESIRAEVLGNQRMTNTYQPRAAVRVPSFLESV